MYISINTYIFIYLDISFYIFIYFYACCSNVMQHMLEQEAIGRKDNRKKLQLSGKLCVFVMCCVVCCGVHPSPLASRVHFPNTVGDWAELLQIPFCPSVLVYWLRFFTIGLCIRNPYTNIAKEAGARHTEVKPKDISAHTDTATKTIYVQLFMRANCA